MQAVFVDANPSLAAVMERLLRPGDAVTIHRDPDLQPAGLAAALGGAPIAIVDHTQVPTEIAGQCPGLRHIVFLGTGARSYMDPDALAAAHGIEVHTIRGYGDTAVAEHAFALMWDAARRTAMMDAAIRRGEWPRPDGLQLTGKTLGLLGFGGIAAEMARLAQGIGMRVLAWNRTPRTHPGVTFVPLETLLAESLVLSVHLLLTDATRGFLSRERLAAMPPGAILINTARGAIVDELALASALDAGHLRHAALDVFETEPLPANHPLTRVPNATLTAHAAFRTPEASDNLVGAALDHCRRIAAEA